MMINLLLGKQLLSNNSFINHILFLSKKKKKVSKNINSIESIALFHQFLKNSSTIQNHQNPNYLLIYNY